MAVYRNTYRSYEGDLTAQWQRVLVLPRYAYRKVFESRFFTVFFVLCFMVPLGAGVLIYLKHNLGAMEMLRIPAEALIPINASFFRQLLVVQGAFAFLLTAFVGPGLVSPDLINNGLPLYLSRAFSRSEYVIGKMAILVILMSCITWLPLGLLFLLQSNLADGWMFENLGILVAIFIGSWIWMIVLSLLALAISAWVRWKSVAGALLFGVFFVGAGFGSAIREIFRTRWGDLFHLNYLIRTIWDWLFFGSEAGAEGGIGNVPVWSAWLVLGLVCGVSLLLLSRRIRAYEVVR